MQFIPVLKCGMAKEWINWSGSMRFTPELIAKPTSEEEVQFWVKQAGSEKKNIRIAGAGHSSVPLVKTDQILVSQENLKGLVDYNKQKNRVTLKPGTSIEEAGDILIKLRMEMHNTGDVDFQFLSGAFGTGTHGSGIGLQNLSGMMTGCRLVNGLGEMKEYNMQENQDMMAALKVSLGALGFFTEVTVKTLPAQKHERLEYCTHITDCLANLDELIRHNSMFDFYWYPRSDEAKIRLCNPIGKSMNINFAGEVKNDKGWLYKILPQKRELRFDEMEYAIPFEAGPECFKEVRKMLKKKHRQNVGWRVLYRTVAADDVLLSPFYKRDSVTIALLQNNVLEYETYFNDMEPLMREFGGRPHWGKKHSMKAAELAELYPGWETFLKIREEMDPNGVFLNDYLKEIFGL